jgi:hypothetical protein
MRYYPLKGFRFFALIGSLTAAQLLSAQSTAAPPAGSSPGTTSQTTTSPIAPAPIPPSPPAAPAAASDTPAAKVRSTRSTVASISPAVDSSLLPAPPPVPRGTVTLMGGIIETVDPVRDQLVLKNFGGGHTRVLFDERTRIYMDGTPNGHLKDLRKGERIHLDTVPDGAGLFAKGIFLLRKSAVMESSGQVLSYKTSTGELTMTDTALAEPVKVRLLPGTVITHKSQPITAVNIGQGSLISVAFQMGPDGRATAQSISVLARRGDTFTFNGRVLHLDLSRRLAVLEDPDDRKTYEVYFDPNRLDRGDALREGSNVSMAATFDGSRYVANTLTIQP